MLDGVQRRGRAGFKGGLSKEHLEKPTSLISL